MTTYCNCKAKDRDGQHMAWCSALSQREAAAEVREKMNRCLAFIADCERHGSIDHGIAFELVNILTALSPSPELPAGGQRETACRCEDPNVCQSCPDRAALPAPAPHAEVRQETAEQRLDADMTLFSNVRAETIEECAKIADRRAEIWARDNGATRAKCSQPLEEECVDIAGLIRALAPPSERETGK